MCAHADYREGFRVCAIELRRLWLRLVRRLRDVTAPGPAPVPVVARPARMGRAHALRTRRDG